jgi:hypothetical protein
MDLEWLCHQKVWGIRETTLCRRVEIILKTPHTEYSTVSLPAPNPQKTEPKSSALFEGSQTWHAYSYDKSSMKIKISVYHWWNDTDRGKPTYSERILSHFHFIHHQSHTDWPVIEPGSPWWEAVDQPPEPSLGLKEYWRSSKLCIRL